MAKPFKDAKSGNYFVSFSFKAKRYKRTTASASLAEAKRTQRIIDGKVAQLKAGLLRVPDGVGAADFVFDGKTAPEGDGEGEGLSLGEFIEAYLKEAAPPNKAESTYVTEQVHLRHLAEFAGEKDVREVGDLDYSFFEAYKRWRHEAGRTNVTINKELGTFRGAFNAGVRSGRLLANPLDGVKWLKTDEEFDRFRTGQEIEELIANGGCSDKEIAVLRSLRYLSTSEITAVLELVSGDKIHAFVATAAYTGMRFSEIRGLRWADVNFNSGLVLARGAKGSTQQQESARYISLHHRLAGILSERRKNTQGAQVFATEDGEARSKDFYYYHIKKLTDGTAFEGIRYHTFRHSFASNLALHGVDQRVIDRFMGHQTEAMRKRYQHLFPQAQQQAIELLDF